MTHLSFSLLLALGRIYDKCTISKIRIFMRAYSFWNTRQPLQENPTCNPTNQILG